MSWLLRLLLGEGGFGRISVGAAMVIALGGGLGAYYVTTTGGSETANIWVDTDGGSCALNGTPAVYDNAAACTLTAAEANFAAGRTVVFKGGNYSQETWTIERQSGLDSLTPGCDPTGEWGTASSTNCVHISVASGENVTNLGGIEIETSGIWLDAERTSGWPTLSPTYNMELRGPIQVYSSNNNPGFDVDHVTVDGVDAVAVWAAGTDKVLIRNSDSGGRFVGGNDPACTKTDEFGNSVNSDEAKIAARNGFNIRNVVLDSIYFHDNDRINDGCHEGALFLVNGDGITIRNSVWSQTWVYAIQIQNFNSVDYPSGVLIENNWFGCDVEPSSGVGNRTTCSGQDAIQFDSDGSTITDWLIRFNSFGGSSGSAGCYVPGCAYSNVRFIGNTGEIPSSGGTDQPCGASGVTFDDNGWDTGTCGAGDTNLGIALSAIFTSVTVGAEDLHLLNGTNGANNLVTTGTGDYALATDIDGQTRPIDSNRDAGSDER